MGGIPLRSRLGKETMAVKIVRLENYKYYLENDERFREIHEKLEGKVVELAKKKGYKRVEFGTLGDYAGKSLCGHVILLTTMTLARLLKRP